MQHRIQFTEAEEFFYRHAGYSHAPDEPAYSGRARGAIGLAGAEAAAHRKGWHAEWEIDTDADTVPTDSYFVSGAAYWVCVLRDADDEIIGATGSVDLGFASGNSGEPADPDGHPCARVIEAELAFEAMS